MLRFGDFELQRDPPELRRNGEVVELHARPLRLLIHLVENRDRIVSKDELFDVIWPGTVVSEAALSQVVKEVRSSLGDDGAQQKWVKTLRGRGFRFVGRIDEPAVQAARGPWGAWASAVTMGALSALGIGAWLLLLRPAQPPSTALVVLPFEDLSPDSDHAYLARGISEELIDQLVQVQGLNVKGRTTGDVAVRMGWDIPEIGRRAGVAKVIEGSVRRADDQLRVTVQLVEASSGFHVWSRTYDRPATEILDLQRDIATAVAAALEVPLQIRRRSTQSVEAWEAYRLGQDVFWAGGGGFAHRTQRLLRAREHLERAIEIDPTFAAAHAAVASTSGFLCRTGRVECDITAQPRAWAAVERALALDPELSAAHSARAFLLADRWDWSGAEEAARRAMELGPPGNVHLLLPHLLLGRGEIDEALELLARAESRDPVDVATSNMGVIARDMAGIDLERALVLSERIRELSPGHPGGTTWRFMALHLLGRGDQAVEAFLEAPGFPEDARQEMRDAYRTSGSWRAFYRVARDRIHHAALGPHRKPCRRRNWGANVAVIHVRAGDLEGALDCLEELHENHGLSAFVQMGTSWLWDPLRDDPRFEAILEGMGLAEISAEALPRVRAYRDCSGPSPSEIRCTDLKLLELASR